MAKDNLDEDACIKWVVERRNRLDALDLPSIVVWEVREKVLSKVKLEE